MQAGQDRRGNVTERDPEPVDCTATPTAPPKLLLPREVPLGGPRAMLPQRTLPQRSRSLIGAWCFVESVPARREGGVTAERQGGFALPDGAASGQRRFEHAAPPALEVAGAAVRVFVGERLGSQGAPLAPTPLIGAEVVLPPGLTWRAPTDPRFETGVLVDRGEVEAQGVLAQRSQLVACPVGRPAATSWSSPPGPRARVLVLAGEPFASPVGRARWGGWNLLGRHHDEVIAARAEWIRQVEERRRAGAAEGRFGAFPDQWDEVLPAPVLPTVRLEPRLRS